MVLKKVSNSFPPFPFSIITLFFLLKGKIQSLTDEFNFEKPKCVRGSYFYNGSCYFISNHRPNVNIVSQTSNLLFSQILNDDASKSLLPKSLQSTFIGTAAISIVLPEKANWLNASSLCRQLHNESTMIYFDDYVEYEFLINLLFKLKFNTSNATDFKKEEPFFIALHFNQTSFVWKWLNDLGLNESFFVTNSSMPLVAQLPILGKKLNDYLYRPCGYMYLRGNELVLFLLILQIKFFSS